MSDKNFKIKPKTWPKEYTFEEFKRLNPNINENLLINYYNKYLSEYAEDRSRHLKHFNDTKENLSKEIKLLKENRKWNSDGDQMVGPTGAGRTFNTYLYSNSSLSFSTEGDNNYALTTKASTLKPELLTLSLWFKLPSYTSGEVVAGTIFDNFKTTNYGWEINHDTNGRIQAVIRSAKTNTTYNLLSGYKDILNDNDNRYYYSTSTGTGWFNIVLTMDGRYFKMYINGELDGSNDTNGGVLDLDGTTGHTIGYGSPNEQLASIGGGLSTNTAANGRFNGIIDEVAVWSTALDHATIKTLYNSGVPKHDLNVDSNYDGYKFYKPYVNNLIAWWRFEGGSGDVVEDSSPSQNHLTLHNSPTWSTSTPE